MLLAVSNAQPESQREYVPPAPAFGNGAAQSGPPISHHINMSNYRVPDYFPLPDVRNHIYILCGIGRSIG
jgi:hypothetical protein